MSASSVKTTSPTLLAFAVFSAGMTILALEMSAARLLGNVFGTSNLVWANVIGLILVYLTAGYFLGGRWADRSPWPATFYRLLAWAAFTTGLAPLAARPVLNFAARAVADIDAAVMLGSFLAVLVLFSVPVTLLGCVSPFAIRLALADADRAGSVAGRLYAISTLGSFAGTFLPVLWLIPTVGTLRTFLIFAGELLAVALYGAWRAERWRVVWLAWMPVTLGLLAALALGGPVKPVGGLLYETESEYNFIQVVRDGETRYLLLNEGQGIHSVYHPTRLETDGPWDYFLAAPYFNCPPHTSVESLGIVGLAAGTIARQYTAVYGPIPIDGFEIDPQIVAVGRRYFDMTAPNLNAVVDDGRWALRHSPRTYSVIAVDAYRVPYVPWHLTTQEFFQEARARLTADGVLAINVGRTPDDRRLVEALAATLHSVFPSVYVVDVPGTFNSLVYATVRLASHECLELNLSRLAAAPPLLRDTLRNAAANLQPVPGEGQIFTDDLAPVEQLTNSIVLRFLLSNQLGVVETWR